MQRLLLMDEQNYDEHLPEICRTAVRGVIMVNGKLLFIEDKFGVLKLPGGGQENGEDDLQTLCREVREETGYTVIPGSVRPWGCIEEKRLSVHEEMIWHQFNHLYFCEVEKTQGECSYSDNEQRYSMHLRASTLEEALAINQDQLSREGLHPWNQREYKTLLLLRQHMEEYK